MIEKEIYSPPTKEDEAIMTMAKNQIEIDEYLLAKEFEEAFSNFIHAFSIHFNINQGQFLRYINGYVRNWETRSPGIFYDDEIGYDVLEQIRLS